MADITAKQAATALGITIKELLILSETWVFQEKLRENCEGLEYARLEPPYADKEKAALELIYYRMMKDLLLVGKSHYRLVLSNVNLGVSERGKKDSVDEYRIQRADRELRNIAMWLESTEREIRLARSVIEGTWRPHPREKTLDDHESDDHHDRGDVWGLEREAYTEWASNSPQLEPIPARTWQAALSDAALFKGLTKEALVAKEKKLNEFRREVFHNCGIFGGAGITQNIEILSLLIQEAEEEARQLGWDGESSY